MIVTNNSTSSICDDYGTSSKGIYLKYRDITNSRSCKVSNNYYLSSWGDDDNSTTSACDDWLDTCYKYSTSTSDTTTAIQWRHAAQAFNEVVRCWTEVSWYGGSHGRVVSRPKPEDRLRTIIRDRQAPAIIRSRTNMQPTEDIREVRARETLLRVLGQQKFRNFLKNGFVSVRAKSGLVYQIFPGHGITSVYRDGVKVERLCVVLKGRFPPTDSLIMRYLLILNDEQDFRSYAISHSVSQNRATDRQVDERPLPEIYRELKVA